ncbi:hypothetical protein FD754_016508 [Muntiacus muntjak]|uniref:Nop domain-containing protein n=1 Tax=Muntiacus muntjak TaxID=9888 RepID=A0A5N3VQV1_MUNMU|nr:hypothetical protein FD754_016508 [Muntiacus muntjak]
MELTGSDHELLIAKFRLKLKKVEKITRPFRSDKTEYLMNCGRFVTLYRRQESRPSPRKRNAKKQNGTGDGQGGLACCSSWGCKEKRNSFQIRKEEISLSLFADDIILYGENQRIHTQKTVRVNRQVQQSCKIQDKYTKINVSGPLSHTAYENEPIIGQRPNVTDKIIQLLERSLDDAAAVEKSVSSSKSSTLLISSPWYLPCLYEAYMLTSFCFSLVNMCYYRNYFCCSNFSFHSCCVHFMLKSLTFWSSITNSVKFSQRDQVSRALKTRGNTPKYRLIFHSTFIGRAAAKNKEQVEEQLSFYETGEIPRKNLDEAAAEITRKLEKQEKKRLKKEKKRLAAIALASSENSSKKKQKPQEALQENGMEDPSVSFSKKKKYFSKEELVSSDLEETAGTGGLPKRKKSFPKEEPVTDPDESENKRAPKKKQKLSSKEEPVSSGPVEAAASQSSGSKKKKKLQKLSQES